MEMGTGSLHLSFKSFLVDIINMIEKVGIEMALKQSGLEKKHASDSIRIFFEHILSVRRGRYAKRAGKCNEPITNVNALYLFSFFHCWCVGLYLAPLKETY